MAGLRSLGQGVISDLALRDVFHDIMCTVTWDVEFTDEFFSWWSGLPEGAQDAVGAKVQLLERRGPSLAFPHSSSIVTSDHAHLRALYDEHLRELREEGLI